MPVIVTDQKEINMHPDLKKELKLIAKSVDEWDGTIIYLTVPEKVSDFISKLDTHGIAFHLKDF
jgi:hypothetical protein